MKQRQFVKTATHDEIRAAGGSIVSDERDETVSRLVTGKRNYRSLFGAPEGAADFRNLGEMSSLILSGRADPRLTRAAHGASTLLGADGGFLVPEALTVELFNSALEQSIVMSRGSLVALINGSRLVAGFDESNRQNGNIYGFSSQWVNEGETLTVSKAKFRQFMLKAKKLAIFTATTNELVADSLNGGQAIEQARSPMIETRRTWRTEQKS